MFEKLFAKKTIISYVFLFLSCFSIQLPTCEEVLTKLEGFSCQSSEPIRITPYSLCYKVISQDLKMVVRVKDVSNKEQLLIFNETEKLTKQLQENPNIIKILKSFISEELSYEVFEDSYATSLKDFIISNPNYFEDPRNFRLFFKKVAQAVKFMHKKGWVHANLKPENIAVDQNVEPKLIEFDFAVKMNNESYKKGTIGYMDPGIMANYKKRLFTYDDLNDVYSLGVTMYEVLHGLGKLPFFGKYESDVYFAIQRSSYIMRKGIPKFIATIIYGCLQMKSRHRINMNKILSLFKESESLSEFDYSADEKILMNNQMIPGITTFFGRGVLKLRILKRNLLVFLIIAFVSGMFIYLFYLKQNNNKKSIILLHSKNSRVSSGFYFDKTENNSSKKE